LFICAHNGHGKNITVCHTANSAEEICTGKHVEMIVAQGASAETAHFTTKQKNYLLSH
jgi:hypothetical protein